AGARGLQGGGDGAVAAGQVEVIHCFGDVEVRVGVEARDELAAAIPQVALDFEVHVEAETEGFFAAEAASELLAHRVVAHVGDVPDHARHGEAAGGRLFAIVVAAVPIGIGHNCLPADLVEGDL